MSKVVLYRTKRRIGLTLSPTAAPNWNAPMDNPDFRAFKGAQADVEFIVRDTDRKPIALSTEVAPGLQMDLQLIATVIDPRTGSVFFQKPLTVVDSARGLARLSLSAVDLMDLDTGFHAYTVGLQNLDGSINMLYVDQYEQARGFFELLDGALPIIRPSVQVLGSQMTPVNWGDTHGTTFVSSALPASSVFGVLTFAIYTTDFTGSFWVEGTLDSSVEQDDTAWFPLEISVDHMLWFYNVSGVTARTVESKVNWIRFRTEAAPGNKGTFDKVLFRN